jgi:hypothetical protein
MRPPILAKIGGRARAKGPLDEIGVWRGRVQPRTSHDATLIRSPEPSGCLRSAKASAGDFRKLEVLRSAICSRRHGDCRDQTY